MFMGSSPGVGGSSGGNGFPFGSMNPNRVVNQTLGFQTNHTVPYAYVIRRFSSGADKALNQGQIVFIKKSQPPVGKGRMYTMMNLPQMNYFLAKKHEDKLKTDPTKPLTLQEIDDEFAPHGVIQGEIGGASNDQPQERLVNVIVAGRVKTFNVFGNDCPDGTPLYIILKKVKPGRDEFNFVLTLTGSDRTAGGREPLLQYVAYASREKPEPGLEELKNEESEGYGKAYYIGRVSRNSRMANTTADQVGKAHYSITKHVTLPMMEVFVDYAL